MQRILLLFLTLLFVYSCWDTVNKIDTNKYYLQPITVEAFEQFVSKTNYVTDAEQYGWSIVQYNVFEFDVAENATWRTPNGVDSAKTNFPVTQVSYNDALAYCKWANKRLPTYEEYWQLTESDKRKVAFDTTAFAKANETNVKGNYWEITASNDPMKIRLAGGSIFCNTTTCNGTSKDRELFVDATTGNIHISFAVVEEQLK